MSSNNNCGIDINDFLIDIPKDTVVFRIGNPGNNLAPFRFFAYWRGNFLNNYNGYKKIWESRCHDDGVSSGEIWKFKNSIKLLKIPYNIIDLEEINEKECHLLTYLHKMIDDKLQTNENKRCFKMSLNRVFFYDRNNCPKSCNQALVVQDKNVCVYNTKIYNESNPDNITAQLFSLFEIDGWIRVVYNNTTNVADEILLINNTIRDNLEFVTYISCADIKSDVSITKNEKLGFLETFEQPILNLSLQQGGDYRLKYKKYKQKYLELKYKNGV